MKKITLNKVKWNDINESGIIVLYRDDVRLYSYAKSSGVTMPYDDSYFNSSILKVNNRLKFSYEPSSKTIGLDGEFNFPFYVNKNVILELNSKKNKNIKIKIKTLFVDESYFNVTDNLLQYILLLFEKGDLYGTI